MKPLYLFVSIAIIASAQNQPQFKEDKLEFPANYREWIFLSSGLGMTYGPMAMPMEPQFDNVFVAPEAYREFLKTGHWPDKTMFVLEIRAAASKGSINKGGNFQESLRAVEVEVKDVARFKEDGWAYFGFGQKREPVAREGKSAGCNTCHNANGAVENTFVQFYPTLLEVAKAKGTVKAGVVKE